ncbi:MAG: acyltransferase, partial [Xanthobacteraceae bacterium]|nr:acyltransferase [Xanthobacteraceae bacterium]
MKRSGTSLALSNLRALVIMVVVAVHSVLAYLDYATPPSNQLNDPPYRWLVTPIVDDHRWIGFDLFCAWQDVYLMSLLFFLSGCFVWTSLERKGSWGFLRDRFIRIGIPLAGAVALLMPLALFPVYLSASADPSLSGYWRIWRSLPFWPCGPQWFLGVLLSFNFLATIVHQFVPAMGSWVGTVSQWMGKHPFRFIACMTFASIIVYVPLAIIFTPWAWISFGPFSFQLSRPVHYAVYFFAGLAAGAAGLSGGLLAIDGALAKRWFFWLLTAFFSFVLWIALTAVIMSNGTNAPLGVQILNDIAFAVSCATSCIFLLALFLRFGQYRAWWSDSLSEHAYGIYVVHYVFVVWAQYILTGTEL